MKSTEKTTISSQQNLEATNKEFFSQHFNSNTIEYLKYSAGARYFRDLLSMTLLKLDSTRVKSVADLGCGVGDKTALIKHFLPKAKVIGFDFSESAIRAAKAFFNSAGVDFLCEDITRTGYKKRFDLISAFEVLEHIEKWEELVDRLISINNRYLLFSFPVGRMRPYEKDIGHYRNFQRNQMETYMKTRGYKTIHTFFAGFPFYPPILRDLTQIFHKNYYSAISSQMPNSTKIMHNIWYILFRYCPLRQRGDLFIGLFEKSDTLWFRK